MAEGPWAAVWGHGLGVLNVGAPVWALARPVGVTPSNLQVRGKSPPPAVLPAGPVTPSTLGWRGGWAVCTRVRTHGRWARGVGAASRWHCGTTLAAPLPELQPVWARVSRARWKGRCYGVIPAFRRTQVPRQGVLRPHPAPSVDRSVLLLGSRLRKGQAGTRARAQPSDHHLGPRTRQP